MPGGSPPGPRTPPTGAAGRPGKTSEVERSLGFALLVALAGLVHALGHLLAGLAAGARLEEFQLGVGPRLLGLGPLSLRLLPLWASVQWEGQAEEGHYQLMPPQRRMAATVGGPLANLGACLVLLGALASLWGRVQAGARDDVVHGVLPGSPGAAAGLKRGDRVLAVNGEAWTSLEGLQRAAEASPRGLLLEVDREGRHLHFPVAFEPGTRLRRVGVKMRPALSLEPLERGQVLPYAVRTTLSVLLAPLRVREWHGGLLRLPDGGVLVGPSGWSALPAAGWVVGAAIVNAWVALMFLLPLPGMDGLRLLIQFSQWRGAAIPASAEERLHEYGVWAFGTAYGLILMILASGD